MFEELDEPFRQLARTVQSVRAWTAQMLKLESLNAKDRQLVEKLEKYAILCQ